MTTQTSLTTNFAQELNTLLTNKIDVAYFNNELIQLKESIHLHVQKAQQEAQKEDQKQNNLIDIDHHDEHVLQHLNRLDKQCEQLTSRLTTIESQHQSFQQRVLERLDLLEQTQQLDQASIATSNATLKTTQQEQQKAFTDLTTQVYVLQHQHQEHKATTQPYDDTELRQAIAQAAGNTRSRHEETAATIKTVETKLVGMNNIVETKVAGMKDTIQQIYHFCSESTQIHTNQIKEEINKALRLRDDLKHRCCKMNELVKNVMKNKKIPLFHVYVKLVPSLLLYDLS